MKLISAIPAITSLALVACNSLNGPVTSSGFDPLLPAGSSNTKFREPQSNFIAGQFVRAAMNNTAFFKSRPNGNADADKLLKKGSSMKVVSTSSSYIKVELDSGEIGFVPTVMIENPQSSATPIPAVNPNEFQVYPPLPNSFDTALPIINPAETPPSGAIPTVIEPESPNTSPTLPAPAAPKIDLPTEPIPTVEIKADTEDAPAPASTPAPAPAPTSSPAVEQE